ncbi:ATPase domain-containing protein [Hippea jasoniae]|uniref:ATPase domain-containing protein n=1 Tax=Hippea jasoniae TaxID=944479 RepID=UPI00055838E4|nr:ATPase domain-containing protein [Hippea jasoniae]
MAKKSIYVCTNCGYTTPKWYGKCPNCSSWGTLVEKQDSKNTFVDAKKPVALGSVNVKESFIEIKGEFGDFFGFKLSKGGVYLVSGTPGVGKSTFLLQLSRDLKKSNHRVVYITAEESLSQIAIRAKRLDALDVEAVSSADIDEIVEILKSNKPDVCIIDSIHTILKKDLDYAVGGIQQVKYCLEMLVEVAKSLGIVLFVVAHITKSGSIAGPKTLEHMVDVVFLIEGEKKSNFRVVKYLKNRFGSTKEALILAMRENGLEKIKDPTWQFISSTTHEDGVAYGITIEGNYPIALEVQALCVNSQLGIPRRVAVGFDINRLNMLLAVLEKRLSLPIYSYDVYLNIAGGIKASSTLIDAAVVAAVISSVKKKPIEGDIVFASEIDLSGNLRLFETDRLVLEQISKEYKVLTAKQVKNIARLYEMI